MRKLNSAPSPTSLVTGKFSTVPKQKLVTRREIVWVFTLPTAGCSEVNSGSTRKYCIGLEECPTRVTKNMSKIKVFFALATVKC